MKSRMLTLMLALVLGAIAAVMVYMYVQRVEQESTQGLQTRAVLITTRSYPAGTPGTEILSNGGFQTRRIPVRYVAPGALGDPQQLASPGLTLANDLAAGEQLTTVRFESSQTDAFLDQFPNGTEALSLPLDFVRGVSGHVQAGDFVNAFVTGNRARFNFNVQVTPSGTPGVPSKIVVGGKEESTFLLLSEIPVIEVLAATPDGTQAAAPTMTLAVSPRDAAKLISAQETAKLWFTLVPQEGRS
jgi:Flp pilus assembly protein CpaB